MLGIGTLTLLALLALNLVAGRRTCSPKHSSRAMSLGQRDLGLAAVLVLLALIGGWAGITGGVIAAVVVAVSGQQRRAYLASLASTFFLGAAGLWVAVAHWPDGSAGFENRVVAVLAYAAVTSAVLRR